MILVAPRNHLRISPDKKPGSIATSALYGAQPAPRSGVLRLRVRDEQFVKQFVAN